MASSSQARSNSGEMDTSDLPPALAEKPAGLPPGKYALVGWDVDTTGRRLIDEMCQIAAYTPNQSYSQYIMPYRDLNPGARRRHNVRVVTVGRYRMLKDTNTHKIIKTKSEVSALIDFLDWLEIQKGQEDSVILIYHESRRLSPAVLIQALIRYHLLERFKTIVTGFADSYALASHKCKNTLKSLSVRVLARLLLENEIHPVDTAMQRATATYKILEQFAQDEQQDVVAGGEGVSATEDMVELAREWARPVHTELEALDTMKDLLERQNTYRLVFGPLLRTTRQERRRVTELRRLLTDAGLVYDHLKKAWQEGQRAGLENLLSSLMLTAKEEDVKELIEIFDCYFDPTKEPTGPRPRNVRNRNVVVPITIPEELYTSDSESSTQFSPSMSFSGLTSALLLAEAGLDFDL